MCVMAIAGLVDYDPFLYHGIWYIYPFIVGA